LKTLDLALIPCTIGHLEALIRGANDFEAAYSVRVADGYLEFPAALDYSLKLLRNEAPAEWLSYLIIHTLENALIGLGGYKGEPDETGTVEIGYGIAPIYRGRGFATQAAKQLITRAFEDDRVRRVIAHTLAEPNASTAVLTKIGMWHIETVTDPDDGDLWRWEIAK
jgi:RimJ/RimL family protein N-acetyltransferase